MFCRLGAKELSAIHPQLKANNIRLIGVGLEELGVEEFVKGDFFAGELFIDTNKKSFSDLGYRRLNILNVIPSILSKKARDAMSRAKGMGIGGDMRGDGFQNGGTMVVSAGGSPVLLDFRQDSPADHVDNSKVLKVLAISSEDKTDEAGGDNVAVTTEAAQS